MLDLKYICENPEVVKQAAKNKKHECDVDAVVNLNDRRKTLITEVEALKKKRNDESKKVGMMMKSGQDASAVKEEVRLIGDKITEFDKEITDIQAALNDLLMKIPNIPHSSVPVGSEEEKNQIIKEWGTKRKFEFKPKPHWEIGEDLGLFDLPCATKLSGTGFILFKKFGAKLERSLINFMLDLHVEKHGYTEVSPPFLVTRKTLTGTGQLPKFEEDMYRVDPDDLFLIPTAEVPVTNIYADETFNPVNLPVYHVAYTPCYRREAGSYGKETRGLTRVHQFDKVEMVKFCLPEKSYEEIETLLANAEDVLQILGLPYRIVNLSTEGISFSAAKCYDIEVWAPGMDMFLEVSSCSNFGDFQARRANIKYKSEGMKKPEFIHTLNASGVALPRTVIAILENYQQADGSVLIPEPLQKYFGADKITK